MIVTRAHVNAAPEALFVIDTGGPGIGVDLTAASLKAAGITPEAAHAQTMLGGGGPTRALPFTAASVTMGSVTRHDVPGVYLPDAKSADNLPFAVGGRISQEFFRHMAVTFDFRAMAIVLE
jgi:predicted aspartyl protease